MSKKVKQKIQTNDIFDMQAIAMRSISSLVDKLNKEVFAAAEFGVFAKADFYTYDGFTATPKRRMIMSFNVNNESK